MAIAFFSLLAFECASAAEVFAKTVYRDVALLDNSDDKLVASSAEQATDLAGLVIVIYCKPCTTLLL